MSLFLLVFGHRPKNWTNWNFDLITREVDHNLNLMVALQKFQMITKVYCIYNFRTMNVCSNFLANPSSTVDVKIFHKMG